MKKPVVVIGAGLAGVETAYYLARAQVPVILYEAKKIQKNPAQKIETFAELVCTNSLKSTRVSTAHGLLKGEMRALNSLVLTCAEKAQVPAGETLAVDRYLFSQAITKEISAHPLITVCDEIADDPHVLKERHEASFVVVATGPLTHSGLSQWIAKNLSQDDLYFYDAIAPVVDADTLDFSKLYFKDRHSADEDPAYLNAPMNTAQYESFIDALLGAEKVPAHDFESEQFFECCLPIDVMAQRGRETPRHSCMKPIGLELPNGERPYAVVQLRKENLAGSAYNLVGFQTRLTYPEQKKVFSQIPGFEKAEFLHLGSVHRNTFVHARNLLNAQLQSKTLPWLFFAGQIAGVEGYTESAAMGLYVACNILRLQREESCPSWPVTTCMGAMVNYLMTTPRPMPSNINFGLFPPVSMPKRLPYRQRKTLRKQLIVERAQKDFQEFLSRSEYD